MAEHADGSIIVDTEMDTEGFKAGSDKIQKAINSMNSKMKNLGPTFQKALSGSASAMSSFDAKASVLESTISEIEAQMQHLGSTNIPTDDYQWLTAEIQKADNELSKLCDRQAKMKATGVNRNSRAWQSLRYDIDLAKRKIAEYKEDQATMRANGTAFQMGSSTAEYSQLESALANAKTQLAEMKDQAEKARKSTRKLASDGGLLKKVFNKIGKSANKSGSAVGKLSGKFKGLTRILKQMLVFRVFTGIITAVKDGFNNLSQYSAQTNADMSALKSSLTQLKNGFATAFAPILTVVTPALTKLIDYLSTAITYVGKLFAALSGAKTFTKAVAVQEDYAASLGSTGKAAKDAQRQLAGFDELNVLTDSSSSDSGGETGSADPSEMFEEVPIESSITDFVGRIKDAFVNGDYDAIGEIIGNGINTAIQKVNDFISWDNLGSKVTAGIKGIAKGFNALVDTVDWKNIGDTFAKGFNTAINTLFLVLTEFDWPGLAAGFANSLNGLVTGIDWGKLGTTLSTGLSTAIATLRSAITTFDWASLGKGIADAIDNIDWVGLLSDIAAGISDILKGALDLLIGFAENLDWGKLGSDLWNSLIGIITNIDWGGIISKAFQLLGAALGGAVSLIVGFAKSLWESLKSAFESTKNYFGQYIDEAGGNVIQGLLNGIWNGIKNIGTWIKDNIFTPFINGFKNAFGIHSPSTVMSEMGGFLIDGLLQGIQNLWSSITGFFSSALSSLKETIGNAWESIKQGASTAWSGIKDTVSNAWTNIKTGVSDACTAVKNGVSTAWTSVKNTVSTKLEEAKTAASTAWNSIKSTASTVGTNIASAASTAWTSVKNHISTNLNNAKTAASTAWNSIKSTATSIGNSVKSGVSSAWTSVKNSISTNLTNAKTAASTAWNSIKSTATTIGSGVKSTVSSAWSGVKSLITGNLNGAKSSASSAWNSIKSTATTVNNNIKSAVSTAWENTKTAVSNKVSSIKSSVSSTFTSMKSSASTWGKDICDNMANGISKAKSTVESAVKGVADKIKSFLGFSEPEDGPLSNFHTYMPDMIDLMTKGIKQNQGQAIGAVSDMASAISNEIQNGDYAMGGIKVDKGVGNVLTGFSDSITDGFSNLIDRLQAIAEGVNFAVPAVATGSVAPYSVSANTNGGNGVTGAIEASNDELANVVTQVVTNATSAIVGAIQDYSGTTVNLDKNSLAEAVIQEINRRTRVANKSPLIG